MPLTSPGNDDDTGENHQPTLRKNTAEPVEQTLKQNTLPLTVARNMGIAVAYLPGTAMRRTAQLLPGDAKTDRRDAHVIAWAALKLPETLRDAGPDDETLAALKLLAGHDEDLANFKSAAHLAAYASIAPVIGAWIHPAQA